MNTIKKGLNDYQNNPLCLTEELDLSKYDKIKAEHLIVTGEET